ncbi:MAG: glycosyl transferase family 2 [Deltaproteobacteria bacterium RBG_16_49_23]|nr:MAG: glycosyl transferase family 2 [Deltaproteobacteria bacterium RBG_16_49_23]
MEKGKVLVIIPAYNEEGSVGKVIEGVRTHLSQADLLIVNDGSTDLTSEKARVSGAVVLDLPYNLGIGGAMQTGYQYASQKGYDIAVQVDGDGQHDPKEIGKLLKALEEKNLNMAIGSRFLGQSEFKSSMMRRVGISIFSGVISILVRQKITDPTSGFRAANRKAIQLFAYEYPQDYPEPEVVVLLHQCHLKMVEVPVGMSERYSGESSITKLRSIYYMVKVLLAIFVDYFKKPPRLGKEEEGC